MRRSQVRDAVSGLEGIISLEIFRSFVFDYAGGRLDFVGRKPELCCADWRQRGCLAAWSPLCRLCKAPDAIEISL